MDDSDIQAKKSSLPFPCDFLSEEEKKLVVRREVKKGDIIYREGETPRGLYYVCNGFIWTHPLK